MQPEQTQTPEITDQPETSVQTPAAAEPTVVAPKKMPRQRHFLAVFFISFMWGMFGVDRMYLGKWGTGILKLITFGGFGLWTLVDFVIIMNGSMHDKQDREMLEFKEYKKFASRTVLIFAVTLGLVILVNGLLLIYGTMQLIESFQGGNLLQVPGLEQQLQSQGIDSSQLQSLGL